MMLLGVENDREKEKPYRAIRAVEPELKFRAPVPAPQPCVQLMRQRSSAPQNTFLSANRRLHKFM